MSQRLRLNRRLTKLIAFTIVLLLVGWFLGWFDQAISDEDQVRAAIHAVAEGAEAGRIDDTIQPFSNAYQDPEGLDRPAIYGLFWSQFIKRGPISVWLSAIDVQVNQGHAKANFDAALVEGQEGAGIGWPVNGDLLTFEVELKKGEEGWQITSHTRRPAMELDAQ